MRTDNHKAERMDILRKELNAFYESQHLECGHLDGAILSSYKEKIASMAFISNACLVITDASADTCFVCGGSLGRLLGIASDLRFRKEFDSSDEDILYGRIHPEDLVEKRMLEYDFFRLADRQDDAAKTDYVATCRLRIRNSRDEYISVDNTTQVLHQAPNGKIWLILCSYRLSPEPVSRPESGIRPRILNNRTGEIFPLELGERRSRVLTEREKEVLRLIRAGKLSKEISDLLRISIHTVNRHRQNILRKLSVANSMEAVNAAQEMKLM